MVYLDSIKDRHPYLIHNIDSATQADLVRIGLYEGVEIQLEYRMPFNGPICLRVNQTDLISIRKNDAKKILCLKK